MICYGQDGGMKVDREYETLIDHIYEAATVPEKWVGVLEEMTALTEGAFSSLVTFDGQVLRWTGTPAALEMIEAYMPLQANLPNPRLLRGTGLQDQGFLTDLDLFTPEEMANDPFYRDFLPAYGGGWGLGCFLRCPTGEMLVMSAERPVSRGPFEPKFVKHMERLRPHYSRAAMIASRFKLERAVAMTDAFAMLDLPAAVLKHGGRLHAANGQFQEMIPAIFQDRLGGLHAVDTPGDALLQSALTWTEGTPPVLSVPLAAVGDRSPLVVHLLPVRGVAHDIFPGTATVMVVTAVVPSRVPDAELLQGLFDLTPAEARVARRIASGSVIKEIAAELRLSPATIRNQLRSVLAKTGLNRQVELAGLLAGLHAPRARETRDAR
jgi:DNA-binding CsgD family transcriptional regulator